MEAEDETLMLAYQGGDASAFETLYRRYRSRIYRLILRGAGDRAIAEEMFQEVWMRLIEARARYEVTARFSTWLYTIAHNRLVDHWRRRRLKTVPIGDDEDSGETPIDRLASDTPDPQRIVETAQELDRLRTAIDALPPVQREAFLLREEGGLSIAEIAQVTGVDEEAAKSRVRYAYSKLRAALEGEGVHGR